MDQKIISHNFPLWLHGWQLASKAGTVKKFSLQNSAKNI
jgi:hypothetical protein